MYAVLNAIKLPALISPFEVLYITQANMIIEAMIGRKELTTMEILEIAPDL